MKCTKGGNSQDPKEIKKALQFKIMHEVEQLRNFDQLGTTRGGHKTMIPHTSFTRSHYFGTLPTKTVKYFLNAFNHKTILFC